MFHIYKIEYYILSLFFCSTLLQNTTAHPSPKIPTNLATILLAERTDGRL